MVEKEETWPNFTNETPSDLTAVERPADPVASLANDLPRRLVAQDAGNAVERHLTAVRKPAPADPRNRPQKGLTLLKKN